MDDNREAMVAAVELALKQLAKAVEELQAETFPKVPMPRPKIFQITPEMAWPGINDRGPVWDAYALKHGIRYTYWRQSKYEAETICNECEWKPRKVLRAIRVLQAATAWCYARAEGRRRAAQEVTRQQQKAMDGILAELVSSKLEAGG